MSAIVWVLLALAAVSFAVLAVVIGKHWKEIRLLDPDSIKEERVRKKRDELVAQRFERIKDGLLTPLKLSGQHASVAAKKAFHGAYLKLLQLDRLYAKAKAPGSEPNVSLDKRLKVLIEEAKSLARDLKWGDAERKYLEVLSMDKRNTEAYRGLAAMYVKQKMYPQAQETYEFLLRMSEADDASYAGLGEIAEAAGDPARAEEMYRKAAELRPRAANRHAALASFYLDRQAPDKAWPFARRATELEPKSLKYLELTLETAVRMGDRGEAEKRYERFRLRSEDRQKAQSFKERIDGMP
ncbi:hypothetical protein HY479_01255 [Candidatus Uhrbacteria bacterium]|nr:hypothetical protein [Candidatus Uhrbacteria bacterium]